MKKRKLGVVMDSIATIKVMKDTSLALLLAAQDRGWQIFYMQQQDLCVINGEARAQARLLQVWDDVDKWYQCQEEHTIALSDLDVILMRKDPPFDMQYIYTTYILQMAADQGVLVVNHPQSLREVNEKFAVSFFPQCCPPSLISRCPQKIKQFIQDQAQAVVKPLGAMGGHSIFRVNADDENLRVIVETMTKLGQEFVLAQRYLPEVHQRGDKRILLIDGEPVSHTLVRKPAQGDFRSNLAVGGSGQVMPLSARDQWLCQQIGPLLRSKGIVFAGIDVIGDYLTEVNVTSPTCVREIHREAGIDIAGQVCEKISTLLENNERR